MIQPVLFYDAGAKASHADSIPVIPMSAKQLGAYYTSSQVADRLVEWGIRSPEDTSLDPSFGGGVFLRAAAKRLALLGGDPARNVFGIEIDPATHALVGSRVRQEFGVAESSLLRRDFFDLAPGAHAVDCVLGNPPFIRFHRFSGAAREMAIGRALECGVKLSSLTSSWAPFLVHAISMVKAGGRLAMVVPAELTYAAYARPVLRHLLASFGSVALLSFRQRLFLDLSEDTYLLLADQRGQRNRDFRLEDFCHIGEVSIQGLKPSGSLIREDVDVKALVQGSHRLVEHYLDPKARDLYRELKKNPSVQPLGTHADIGIGYVTGANRFFHLSQNVVDDGAIPRRFLQRAILRGRAITGTRFTQNDWSLAEKRSDAGYLLSIPPDHDGLPEGIVKRLSTGLASGVADGFKCRNRKPWYSVPHVYVPDAMLTYMSGRVPKLVANDAGAVAPNTLHILRMRGGARSSLASLLVGWQTSLARLSIEIEGHAMGGGMLKIEPTEAERVRVPAAVRLDEGTVDQLDGMLRSGREAEVQELADELVLRQMIGLSKADCDVLAEGGRSLALRRTSKGL